MESCPVVETSLRNSLLSVCPRIVLASQSPNRRKILSDCGVEVVTRPQDIWEICGLTEPSSVVTAISKQKYDSYLSSSEFDPLTPAVAVDTLVSLNGELLGKPKDRDEAFKMLSLLSGRWHEVYSGMSVYNPKDKSTTVVCDVSRVLFKTLSTQDIDWYIGTGDCIGAAGAYKIQSSGYRIIDSIEGSFSNIIGIPLERLVEVLR